MIKQLFIITLLALKCNIVFSQLTIRELKNNGEYSTINKDSVFNIASEKLDSIILSKLMVPDIDDSAKCRYIEGHIYYEYKLKNYRIENISILRGICDELDSILIQQSNVVCETTINNTKLNPNKTYSLIIPFFYSTQGQSDSIYKRNRSDEYSFIYVVEKEHPKPIPPKLKIHVDIDSNDLKYIPKNLYECFEQLDKFIDDTSRQNIRNATEKDLTSLHFNFGMFLRNNWGLWSGSRLYEYFSELGVNHPDNMTGIIFTGYYRYLTGEDIKLEEQIQQIQDYNNSR